MTLKKIIDERLAAKKRISEEYQIIKNKMIGNMPSTIFNCPVYEHDLETMVVAAYYLAKLEDTLVSVEKGGEETCTWKKTWTMHYWKTECGDYFDYDIDEKKKELCPKCGRKILYEPKTTIKYVDQP